jgi:hypothetical protein
MLTKNMTPPPSDDDITILDLAVHLADRIWWIVLAPLAALVIGYGASFLIAPKYTSVAYFKLDDASRNYAREVILSPAVLDEVIARLLPNSSSPEIARRELLEKLSWHTQEAIVDLTVTDEHPGRAQSINRALIEGWLEKTKPGPDEQIIVQEQLEVVDEQLGAVSSLLTRLSSETPQLVIPGMENELASSLAALQSTKSALSTQKGELQRKLLGTSRDVVLVPPTLPVTPSSPDRAAIAIYSALAVGVFVLVVTLALGAVSDMRTDPLRAEKLQRIKRALVPIRRKTEDAL